MKKEANNEVGRRKVIPYPSTRAALRPLVRTASDHLMDGQARMQEIDRNIGRLVEFSAHYREVAEHVEKTKTAMRRFQRAFELLEMALDGPPKAA